MGKKIKVIELILCGFILIYVFLLSGLSVMASEYTEAFNVDVNEPFFGNVTNGYRYQKNSYKFQITSAGVIKVKFSAPLQGNKDKIWKYEIVDASYETILTGDVYGNVEETYSTALGLPAGDYYLIITSTAYSSAVSKDRYTIKIEYDQSELWETEFNDSFLTADDIVVNKSYSGTTKSGYRYENDYYKFSIVSSGPVRVRIDTPMQESKDVYWDIHIYNDKYNEVLSGTIKGNYSTHHTPSIGLRAGTYYIKMSSHQYSDACSTDIYTITAEYSISDYWETEFNDSFQTANEIKTNTSYYGSTMSGSDEDYFKFYLSSYGQHYFRLYTNQLNTTDRVWKCTLYDSSYTEIYSCYFTGNSTYNWMYSWQGAGYYYYKIQSAGYSSWNSSTWRFMVDEYKPKTEAPKTENNNSGVKKGYVYKKNYGKYTISYVVTGANTVAVKAVSSGKNKIKKISIPTQIEIKKKIYKVTSIGSKAFANCKNLSYVKISANVKKIGVGAFSGCKKLKTLNVYTTKLNKANVKGCLKGSSIKSIKTYKSKKKAYTKIFKKSITNSKYNVKVK